MKLRIGNITCIFACATSFFTWADTQSAFTFSGKADASAIYNSALSVDELDDVSTQSDSGQKLNAMLQGKWKINDKAQVTSRYAYSQQRYNQYSQYDLELHQFSLDGSYKFTQREFGLRFDGAKARLETGTFLDFQQMSVYLGTFIQPETFLRTSLKFKNKSFTQLYERDANGFGASADLFHFLNNANTMLMIGLSGEIENAHDNQFNYWAAGLNTKLTHKFDMFGLASKVGIGWRYQYKDYESVEVSDLQASYNIQRDENRQVIQADWVLNIFDNLSVVTEVQRGDYKSKVESLTYQQNIASLGLNYTF
ncbi:hypothetical protein [Aliiglaciecola sp. NS0011-25]|uniref:hypothetical protein n=1 Tax=Aliiglaciecola sp. NS0011-25 TaxID=3127654 RepID=UPI003104D8B9